MSRQLHVLVAEAMGWRDLHQVPSGSEVGAYEYNGVHPVGTRTRIPRYDTDWSATGPLIERYGLDLVRRQTAAGRAWGVWGGNPVGWRVDQSPLVAVCLVIVALAEAGKLEDR